MTVDDAFCEVCDGMSLFMMYGQEVDTSMVAQRAQLLEWPDFEHSFMESASQVDIVENCGGSARTLRRAARPSPAPSMGTLNGGCPSTCKNLDPCSMLSRRWALASATFCKISPTWSKMAHTLLRPFLVAVRQAGLAPAADSR